VEQSTLLEPANNATALVPFPIKMLTVVAATRAGGDPGGFNLAVADKEEARRGQEASHPETG
jgi:hypothetical protein